MIAPRRRPLYNGGPHVSPLGFGSYRIGMHPRLGYPLCAEALEKALREGINLIDTSANYGDGLSEVLIGQTLKKILSEGIGTRDDFVVVSKAGYIQGSNMAMVQMREAEGEPFENILRFSDDIWYSIDPKFIKDQVERSRGRLGLEKIDVFLIHNPEYVLKYFEINGHEVESARKTFYEQLAKTMDVLEECVKEGKIGCYGISSNTFGFPLSDPTAVTLTDALKAAESISSQHHFKVIQCPINWIEPLPALAHNEGSKTLCEMAQEKGIGVMVNRPLNAMHPNGLIRLTRPQVTSEQEKNLSPDDKEGLKNWKKLATDLERMAKEQIDVPGYDDAPLSQVVLTSLMWLPGVTTVLCGMRKPSYVDDGVTAMKLPKLLFAQRIVGQIFENLEFTKTEQPPQ